jgi:hypothetical protein
MYRNIVGLSPYQQRYIRKIAIKKRGKIKNEPLKGFRWLLAYPGYQ